MNGNAWGQHPAGYRQSEVKTLLDAMGAGECVSLIGLSGMGKSNLLGFMAYRLKPPEVDVTCVLVDCNRMPETTAQAFFTLAAGRVQALEENDMAGGSSRGDLSPREAFEAALAAQLAVSPDRPLALLLDGFDDPVVALDRPFFNNLRALRDAHKYRLVYLVATRRPLSKLASDDKLREFSDLFAAHQIWLGPLSKADARWSLSRLAERHGLHFNDEQAQTLFHLSGRHPGLLKAIVADWEGGDPENPASWLAQPPVARECSLLWEDLPPEAQSSAVSNPSASELLRHAGLAVDRGLFSPVFAAFVTSRQAEGIRLDPATGEVFRGEVRLPVDLTAKEHALLSYLIDHLWELCEKDDLIRAVWPEDKIFERGVRDDSLAQLVRRLRLKIEPDPSDPQLLLTVPGRGYRLVEPGAEG